MLQRESNNSMFQDRMILIELNNNLVVATIVDGSERISLSSQGAVTQNEWHHILLQIGNSQPNT